jgi:hypothetical protein
MPEYVYLIHPLRDAYFDHPTVHEEQVMEEHFAYLKGATEREWVMS